MDPVQPPTLTSSRVTLGSSSPSHSACGTHVARSKVALPQRARTRRPAGTSLSNSSDRHPSKRSGSRGEDFDDLGERGERGDLRPPSSSAALEPRGRKSFFMHSATLSRVILFNKTASFAQAVSSHTPPAAWIFFSAPLEKSLARTTNGCLGRKPFPSTLWNPTRVTSIIGTSAPAFPVAALDCARVASLKRRAHVSETHTAAPLLPPLTSRASRCGQC
jgi:hypothetical protein